jgi:hypothetical protein
MNSIHSRRARHAAWLASLALAAIPIGLQSAGAPIAGAETPKTHNLYMGADLSVERNGRLYPVFDVVGDALVINVEGKRTEVPLNGPPVAIKIQDTLRLGGREALVDGLKTERAYTPARDPGRRFLREAGAAGAAGAEVDLAVRGLRSAEGQLASANAMPMQAGAARDNAIAAATDGLARAGQTLDRSSMAMGSDFNSGAYYARQMEGELSQKLFDAIDITFRVSSSRPLDHPYIIAISQIHDKDAKPGEFRNWILAKSLDAIEAKPQKIHIFEGGLPPGYDIDWFHLHLYDHGVEMPTSVASKRVPLTLDEAFQFVLLEYLSAHKKDTLPPTPGVGLPPDDLRKRVAAGEFTRVYYVKVSQDGMANEVFVDESCTERLREPYVESAVKSTRFKPALKSGQPVDGVAAIKMGQLLF